ncbi:glycosyltransferase [Bacteroides intestinalis]|uniref:Glycosyltransferase n=1 Tax=Bacteroides intestinalis TaxID=329854 RepID=A0A414LED8_9BACE|nr:glycosyltransferase [Bacteroides intestinalis]RHE93020.1 glycosyltransferase [Bacteroides intestinalis]
MEYRLVSVIIPIYNMAKFLCETLDSVLASDYPNFEVILMDDGSTDNSLDIAKEYAEKDSRVCTYTQSNSGPCVARNNAISLSHGEYILPVDADNRISPTFISHAVAELERDPEVKVVCPRAEFIGDRSGEWKLPPFSLKLLARKNMIDTCALYRKTEWERVGGYCEEIIAREDWEFWISVLKDGGKVVRLPQIELYYRVRAGSKRIIDRSLKPHVTKVLNKRHAEFFERELGGKLRSVRSWSRWVNRIERFFRPRCMAVAPGYENMSDFIKVLPVIFEDRGTVIYKGRNELREFDIAGQKVVVKSFQIPHLLNRIIYNFFRESKARRSFRYAAMLRQFNIGSPTPIGFCSVSSWFLFGKSYFVSLRSECPYTYRDLPQRPFEEQEEILRAIARATAALHEHGILHKDYSAGNILFAERPEGVSVEIIDLNRMRFGKVSLEEGCKNFERLPGTDEMFAVLADEYAKSRGFNKEKCLQLIEKAHKSSSSFSSKVS